MLPCGKYRQKQEGSKVVNIPDIGIEKSWLKWKQVYEINKILENFGICKETLPAKGFLIWEWKVGMIDLLEME